MIPAYNREDCLTITLEQIAKTAEQNIFYYLFVLDTGFRSTVLGICNRWLKSHKGEVLRIDPSQARSPIKQSYALYKGYHRALEITSNYVFMIEDDIAISNRFFEWHYKILEKLPDVQLSIGTRQRDIPYPLVKDFDSYIIRSDYQSLGVCWRKDALYGALQLFKPEYWHDPFGYIERVYPQVRQHFVASQDGLIHKHIIANGLRVAFPVYPRAFHFGVAGANRPVKRITGTLEQKIAKVKQIAFNEAALKAELAKYNAPLDPYFYDSIPIDLVQVTVNIGDEQV